MLERRSVMCLF